MTVHRSAPVPVPRTYAPGGFVPRPSGPASGPYPSPAARPQPRPVVIRLTVAEVAAELRVSKMTVYRLIHGGELAAHRVGRSFRVPASALDDYLQDAS